LYPTTMKHRKKSHELLGYEALFRRIIDSIRIAHLVVNYMNLKYMGKNKGRKYISPGLNNFPQKSTFPLPSNFNAKHLPQLEM